MKALSYGMLPVFGVLLIAGAVFSNCGPAAGSPRTELMVFAAMSLKKPMTQIAQVYERQHPGLKVYLNCAGSSSLAAQIINGAPADVFVSASDLDMDTIMQKGLTDQTTRKVFAFNSVVLVSRAGSQARARGFADLTADSVKRIAIGNTRLTPAGRYAEEVLEYFGIRDQIQGKMIYCDTVAQICDYTSRGEVDVGIVYFTDYILRQDTLLLIETAPAASHDLVEYPVAVIRGSGNQLHARQFIELLCSSVGAEILSAHGFSPLMEASR